MNTEVINQAAPSARNEYRYKHFTTALLMHDLRFQKGAPPHQVTHFRTLN